MSPARGITLASLVFDPLTEDKIAEAEQALGHFWVASDYRARGAEGEPSVVWFDNEVGQDVQVAADFLSFVEGLRPGRTHGGFS
jgi:hypothetical protein